MSDPVCRAFQCDASEEENDEHNVREDCGNVNDFSTLGDALNHAQIYHSPSHNQG